MTYFDHCANLDELKAAYKTLALKHYPDMGGDERAMKAINAEYDKVFAVLKELHNFEADMTRQGASPRFGNLLTPIDKLAVASHHPNAPCDKARLVR